MKKKVRFVLLALFAIVFGPLNSLVAQITEDLTHDIKRNDGIYCETPIVSWFDPTVQAIQDRYDLSDFGGLQLDSIALIKLLRNISRQSLSYSFYEPTANYSTKKPLIIFAHGGAFLIGGRESLSTVLLCKELAGRGYATASIEYRLKALNTFSFVEAGYLAMQDGNAAIRYFKANADRYNIDPNRIFIAGISAGGILALHAGHFDNKDDLLGINDQLNDAYGCFKCMGSYASMDNSVAGVINIVGATTSPDILDNIPTLHIYTPTDSVVPSKVGIPLANLSSSSKLPGFMTKILNKITRPTCYGPEYFKSTYNLDNHSYCDINQLSQSKCDHSFIISNNGTPTIAGMITVDVINKWLMKQLAPSPSLSTISLSRNKWSLINMPQNIVDYNIKDSTSVSFRNRTNNSIEVKAGSIGIPNVTFELINELGLKSYATLNSLSGPTEIENDNTINEINSNNYMIILSFLLSISIIVVLFKRYY